MAFAHIGFTLRWEGDGVDEVGILDALDQSKYDKAIRDQKPSTHSTFQPSNLLGQTLVKVDPSYFRPTEVDLLLGDPTKSKTQLGWEPEYDLKGLVQDMMISDLLLFQKDLKLAENAYRLPS
jgi:GDPmannose 4,6-dehydratase